MDRLEWLDAHRLVAELRAVLSDTAVHVPTRLVQALPGGGSLFVMPAHDARVAMAKLISFTPANAGSARPSIQGDVLVFDVKTGERVALLDGPAVTAHRTAAVSLLAAQSLAPVPEGPLLLVGAGVQARAHLRAFAQGLPLAEVLVVSRTLEGARRLADEARQRWGLRASVEARADDVLAQCPLVVTCTPAREVVCSGTPHPRAFIAAVGAFTPAMRELSPELCRDLAARGRVVLDTPHAQHEAGDLIQAGLAPDAYPSLAQCLAATGSRIDAHEGPVLFKSCGWAGWDLAVARCAAERQSRSNAAP